MPKQDIAWIAVNIVNQLFDIGKVDVATRQSINDRCYAFVSELIGTAVAGEQAAHLQTIDERDEAEDAFDELAGALGVETEYSNNRGIGDVLAECLTEIERLKEGVTSPSH